MCEYKSFWLQAAGCLTVHCNGCFMLIPQACEAFLSASSWQLSCSFQLPADLDESVAVLELLASIHGVLLVVSKCVAERLCCRLVTNASREELV